MKTFRDLKFKRNERMLGGIYARMNFRNGFGVSVVQGPFSYGGPRGLYELGVTFSGVLCYDSGITKDVEGWLTPRKVTALMKRVQALPKRKK